MLHWEQTVACEKQTLACNYLDTIGENNWVKKVRQHRPLLCSTLLRTYENNIVKPEHPFKAGKQCYLQNADKQIKQFAHDSGKPRLKS